MKRLTILKISFHNSSTFVRYLLEMVRLCTPSRVPSAARLPLSSGFFFPFLHVSLCGEQNEDGYVVMKNTYPKSGQER